MAQQPTNSVFISYRRDVSGIHVLAIYQHLSAHNIDAFYDIEDIKAGQFGEVILGQIAARPYFMPVFAPGTLDRCVNPTDWVRREIEHAINIRRVLVPLHTHDFKFDDIDRFLPHLAATIRTYNMVELPTEKMQYFRYVLRDVVENYLTPITLDLAPTSPAAAAKVAEAKGIIDAAPSVNQNRLTAQEYLNRARSTTNLDEQVASFTEAIRIQPKLAEAYAGRGIAYSNLGYIDEAINDLDEAISINKYYVRAYDHRGVARSKKADFQGAIEDFTEAIRLQPTDAFAYAFRGITHSDMGNREDALRDYSQAIKLEPDDYFAYGRRGDLYAKTAKRARAVADYKRCLELNPNHASAQTMSDYMTKYGKPT